MPPTPSPSRTWLQLLRAPNLFTVPGDPLAGYLLACYGAVEGNLGLVIAASLCFYAGGLLVNDLADVREDARERPDRPLPSGAAKVKTVFLVALALFTMALLLCWQIERATFAVGGLLLLAITSYDFFSKKIPTLGALNMGLCRGLSFLLGATAVPHGDLTFPLMLRGRLDHVITAAALITVYITAVTNLARHETRLTVPVIARWLPTLAVAIGGLLFLQELSANWTASALLFVIATVGALHVGMHLTSTPASPVPPKIGELIRLLLLIQAALCAPVGGVKGALAAGLLLILWPISGEVGRKFYAS